MATKKPATKKVAAKTPAKTTAKKATAKKTAVKKETTAKDSCLFQVTAKGDDIGLKVEGNAKTLLEALASVFSHDEDIKRLVKMAVMVA